MVTILKLKETQLGNINLVHITNKNTKNFTVPNGK